MAQQLGPGRLVASCRTANRGVWHRMKTLRGLRPERGSLYQVYGASVITNLRNLRLMLQLV